MNALDNIKIRKEHLKRLLEIIQEIYGLVPILFTDIDYADFLGAEQQDTVVATEYVNAWDVRATINRTDAGAYDERDRIYRQIQNAYDAVYGDLFVVIDDFFESKSSEILKEIVLGEQEEGKKIFYVNNLAEADLDCKSDYENFFQTWIAYLSGMEEGFVKKEGNLVNVFGIVPGEDIYFRGNLDEIVEILNRAGFHVNRFFGTLTGAWELENIFRAEINLVFSRKGISIARNLEKTKQARTLYYPCLPVGPDAVHGLLRDLEQKLGKEKYSLTATSLREEEYFQYYLKGIWHSFYQRNYCKWIGMVGTEQTVLEIGSFLKTYLGAGIRYVVLTDGNKNLRHSSEWNEFAGKIYFSSDKEEIKLIIRENEADVLFGSSLQRDISRQKNIPLIEVTAPLKNQVVLSKTYAGIRGAQHLMEEYLTAIEGE